MSTAPPKTPSTGISDLVLNDIDAALQANTTATTAAPAPADAPRPKPSPYDDLEGLDVATVSRLTGGMGKERWQAKTPEERAAWLEQVEELDRRFPENGISPRRPAGGAAFGLGDVHSSTGAVATVPVPPPLPPAVQAVRDAVDAERHNGPSEIQPAQQQLEPVEQQPEDQDQDELQDGVLPPAGAPMVALQGLVGAAAAGEAAFNIFKGVHELMGLPLYMSLLAPLLFEAAASSFAIQDMLDRRRGVESRQMAWAAQAGIAVSAVIGAVVGFFLYGPFGLAFGLASVIFGGMLHVHGERAIRAHKSRMKTSRAWKRAQQRAAETDSARDVLQLLLPSDADGRATAALLHKRMDAGTLTPGDALIAAGWHRRAERGLSDSQMIRLETVAATVWGAEGLPSPPPPPAAPRRSNRRTSSGAGSQGGATGGARGATGGGEPSQGSQGGTETSRRRRLDDDALIAFIGEHLAAHPGDGERPVMKALAEAGFTGSVTRVRNSLKFLKGHPDPKVRADALGSGDGK